MDELFKDLPKQDAPVVDRLGKARLRVPVRDQVRLEAVDLDALIGEAHPARLIWSYVEKVDFTVFEAGVRAREGRPGMPQTSPRLLLALWLYATSDGVGSAREVARLCEYAPAYRWLCGGVTVNHHAISDFRTQQGALVEDLLVAHVASLASAGVIDLDEIAQDGVKVRANAGAKSFRRRRTLKAELTKARAVVRSLATEAADVADQRRQARRSSAARDRQARVERALVALGKAEEVRARREKKHKAATQQQKEPRASTTDPDARVMKMADGGFRPAFNIQFASLPQNGVIIAVDVETTGSDRGRAEPMAQKIERAYGRRPARHLVDGGYQAGDDIEAAHAAGTKIFSPPIMPKSGVDPHLPREGDGPGVAEWRERMGGKPAKLIFSRRPQCELVHAKLRNLTLDTLGVRGVAKVKTWMTGFALSMNILTEARLQAAAS